MIEYNVKFIDGTTEVFKSLDTLTSLQMFAGKYRFRLMEDYAGRNTMINFDLVRTIQPV